jgi:hypothetical protein
MKHEERMEEQKGEGRKTYERMKRTNVRLEGGKEGRREGRKLALCRDTSLLSTPRTLVRILQYTIFRK